MIYNVSWAEGPWIILGVLACTYCLIWLRKTILDVYYHISNKINGVQLYASFTMLLMAMFITAAEIAFTAGGLIAGFTDTTSASGALSPSRVGIIACLMLGQLIIAGLSFTINHRYNHLVYLAKLYAAKEALEKEQIASGQTQVTEGDIVKVTIEAKEE